MNEILLPNARLYASRRQLETAERLGSGKDGIVLVAKGKENPARIALKAHAAVESYLREKEVYQRLKDAGIRNILGFHVPELRGYEDALRVIEMTIVTRPFVLDFAGAYLDIPPEFSDEVWAEWEAEKREQFGPRWPTVQAVLGAFEELDIHLLDVSPSNIAFLD